MEGLVKSLAQVNIFGSCDSTAIQSLASENMERDRLMRLEHERQRNEWLETEAKRKQQEEEDHLFAIAEQERINRLTYEHMVSLY